MRQFYEQVHVDALSLHFHAACELCGKKQYGARVPSGCRSVRTLAKCVQGKANKISQSLYNHAKASSTQLLAIHFNKCRKCYRWVCDDCYDADDEIGVCMACSKEKNEV